MTAVLAVVAAFCVSWGSGSSGHDLYVAYRFLKISRKTVFAHFPNDSPSGGGLEYAVPE
jgi:hypothetical protein